MTEDALRQFLDNQAKELEMRRLEIGAEEQRETNAHDYAKTALTVTAGDRREHRDFIARERTKQFYFASFLVVCMMVVLGFLVLNGERELAAEAVKALGFALAGAATGYSFGKKRKPNGEEKPQ